MPTPPRPRVFRPGSLLSGRRSTLPWIPDVDHSSAVVDFGVYRDGVRQPDHPTWQAAYEDVVEQGRGFIWIGLHEPSEAQLAGFADRFDLHPLAIEDAVNAHQRPKLDQYDNSLFAVVRTVHHEAHQGDGSGEVTDTGELMLFVGSNYVVTVRHGEHGNLRAVRRRLENDRELLARGPSVVLHAVLDFVVDGYLNVVKALQVDLDDVENSVFTGANRSADTNRMYVLKREVLELRRAAAPLDTPLRILADDTCALVADDVHEYFRDVQDHLSEIVERVGSFDDLLNNLVGANLAQVTVAQNEDMRKISAWVAIAAVPTMVAGLYGMNFTHMPELHWQYSYPVVIGALALICTGMYRAFKRNGWL